MNRRFFSAAVALSLAMASAYPQIKSTDPQGYFISGVAMFDDANYTGCIDRLSHVVNSPVARPDLVEQARYYIALSSLRQGNVNASDLLEAFVSDYPASPLRGKALIALADYYYDLGEWNEAIVRFSKVDGATLDPESRDEFDYHRAYCMLMSGRDAEAAPIFNALMSSRTLSNEATFYTAYILYREEKFADALSTFKKVKVMADGPTASTDYYLCQLYYRQGDYGRAYTTAAKLVANGGNVDSEYLIEAMRIAGESAYSTDKMSQAVDYLTKYSRLAHDPQPSALYILGLSQYRLGQYENAVSTLRPVLAENNEMGQSAALLTGQAYVGLGEYSKAVAAFEKSYRMNEDRSISETALYNYALARMQGGKMPFSSSVTIVKRFLSEFPDSPYASTMREYLVAGYMTDNNYEAALAGIEEISRPSDALLDAKQQILYTLGTRDLAASHPEVALTRFRQAKALGNRVPQIYNEIDLWIGECLYKEGEYAKAADSYRAYLNGGNSRANAPLARYDLGYALFGEKNFTAAYNAFDSFTKNPGNATSLMKADALNRMADCLYYQSEFNRAAVLYERAYQADPAAGDYALFQQAVMKGLRRDHNAKIEGLQTMMDRFPESALVPSALLETAESWQELGNTGKVIETYKILTARYPSTAQGRQGQLLLAITYLNSNRSDEAADVYRKVITDYPSSEEARIAADDLKRIAADNGTLAEFASFMRSVPDAPEIDSSEIEKMAFESAEKEFEKSGRTRRLEAFVKEYQTGPYTPSALLYIARSHDRGGNYSDAMATATDIITRFPHSSVAEEAYLIKASGENALDMTREAFETYSQLASQASSSVTVNAARLGMMRTARDLGEAEAALNAADQLLSSSTVGSNEREEVTFSRGVALEQLGRSAEACEAWKELAADPSTLYGAKSAFYLAQHYFNNENLAESRREAEALVEANPPHNYWLARTFILLSDINRAEGNKFEADEYLRSLRENYPGSEPDIFTMIDSRLDSNK